MDEANDRSWPDEKIQNISVWGIEKHSILPATWRFTLIGIVHPTISELVAMQVGELPIVSCFISEASWYLLTTRRIIGTSGGRTYEAIPVGLRGYMPGNFKGYGGKETDVMALNFSEGNNVQLEYETGKASMAPIYYMRFWRHKYPVLDKLSFDPRPQPCPHCGKSLRTAEALQCLHCGADWHADTHSEA